MAIVVATAAEIIIDMQETITDNADDMSAAKVDVQNGTDRARTLVDRSVCPHSNGVVRRRWRSLGKGRGG